MHADTSAVSLAFQQWLEANGVRLGEIQLSSVKVEGGGNADGSGDGGGGESDRPRPQRLRRRRTVLSTASSAPGSLIARVPDSAVLTVSSSSASEALEAAGLGNDGAGGGRRRQGGREEEKPRHSSPWKEAAGLALALLVESRLGRASRFAPYVRWLLWDGDDDEGEGEGDQKTTHPVTWDPRAAAVLFAGTAVAPRLLRLPSYSSSSSFSSSSSWGDGPAGGLHAPSAAPLAWSRLARPWLSRVGMEAAEKKKRGGGARSGGEESKGRSSSPSPSPPRSLRAEFLRCLAVVSSHAFVLGEDQILALVPVFDALDHAPGPARVRLSHSCSGGGAEDADDDGDGGDGGGDGNGEGEGEEEEGENGGFLEMRSTVALSRGEEVFNSYGRLSTSALARRYGFAPVADGMLRSGDERLEVAAGEVGVAAATAAAAAATAAAAAVAAAAGSSSCSARRRPLRAPAACLRAAAASRGRPLFVSVPTGEPSLGLLLAVRASLLSENACGGGGRSKRNKSEDDEDEDEEERHASLRIEGRALLEVARRRRAALEAGGARAARALAELGKRKRGGRNEGGKGGSIIVFPPASGFELAEAVRRSELEGCACLESWVKRRMLL